MPNPAKRKGDDAEREVARLLADLTGFPVERKLGAGRRDDTGDLHGLPDTTAQVRNYASLLESIRTGLRDLRLQQANARTPFGVLFARRRGGRWIAVMELDQYAALLREATTEAREISEFARVVRARMNGDELRSRARHPTNHQDTP